MSEKPIGLACVHPSINQNRIGAILTGGGISILLVRAALMISGSASVLRRWVINLAAVELALDVATLVASVRWWITDLHRHRRLPMRLTAAAIILHAVRVAIFVLGRLRPFKDFDVRPEERAVHEERWSWSQVIFAAVMSVLGVVGVLVVRRRGR